MTKNDIPKVAIITRTKDRPIFLERAIKSVLKQTFKDYVHVILNDGGNKKKVESILKKYPAKNRVIIHNANSVGLTRALNQAITSVDSEYVTILDDDDAWNKDRLKLNIELINELGSEATVVPMEIVVEDVVDGSIIEVERIPHPQSWSGEVSLYKQLHQNFLSNGCIMYKRNIYNLLGGYDESLTAAEDWDFGIRLMKICDVDQVLSDQALVYYHQRPLLEDEILGNSVHSGVRNQERTIMIIRNRYLREDLKNGTLGAGYIMNDIENSLNSIARLEGHVNRGVEEIKKELASIDERKVSNKIKRAVKDIIK